MTGAKNSFGTELWLAPSGESLVKVADLFSVTPPKLTRGTQDATTHDSPGGAQEVIGEGTYKVGTISGQGHYIAESTGDTALLLAAVGGALQDYKIVTKSAAGTVDMTGSGYVTEYGPDEMTINGKQTFSLSIEPTGEQVQA